MAECSNGNYSQTGNPTAEHSITDCSANAEVPEVPELEPQQEYPEGSGRNAQDLPASEPQQEYPEASGGSTLSTAQDGQVVPVSQQPVHQLQQEINTLRSQLAKGPACNIRSEITSIGSGNKVYIQTDHSSPRRTRDTDHRRVKLQGHMSEVIMKDDEVFIETSAYHNAKECLERQRHVTIVGRPGSGKTSMAYHLLRHYKKQKYDVLILLDPKELRHDRKPGIPTILLIDDIFGSVSFSPKEFQKWDQLLETELLPLLEKTSGNVKAIFTSRGYVYQEASPYLVLLSTFLFDENDIIDLSGDMSLVKDERLAILTKHKELSNFKMSSDTIDKLCDVQCSHGFPHVCKLFFSLHQFQEDPVEFFENPLPCLQNTIRRIEKTSPEKYAAMVLVVLMNNDLNIQSLDQNDKTFQRLHQIVSLSSFEHFFQNRFDIFRSMLGGFLKNDGDTFSFLHSSIHDTVAYLIGVRNPAFVIENTSAVFLFERIKIHLDDKGRMDKGTREDLRSFTIFLSEDWYPLLSKQFAQLVLREDISLVCSHQALQSERFIMLVFDFLEGKKGPDLPEFISSIKDQEYQKSFLYWSTWNQTSILTNIVLSKFAFADEAKYEAAVACCHSGNEDSFAAVVSTLPVDMLSKPIIHQDNVPTLKKPKEDFPDSDLNLTLRIFKNSGKELENIILLAARYGRMKIVKLLLEEKRVWAVKRSNLFGDTLLQKSCLSGNIKLIRYLLDHNVDKNQQNMNGMAPLHYACAAGNTEVVKLLLHKPEKPVEQMELTKTCNKMSQVEPDDKTSQDESVEQSSRETPLGPNMYGLAHFFHACVTSNTQDAKIILLKLNKAEEQDACTDILHEESGQRCSLGETFKKDETVEISRTESLDQSSHRKPFEYIGDNELSGEMSRESNKLYSFTASKIPGLFSGSVERSEGQWVEHYRHEGSVKMSSPKEAMKHGSHADIDIQTKGRLKEAMKQCSHAHTDIQTKGGLTPLMFACMYGHRRVVELLLENKADINLTDNDGYTVLMLPCITGHHRMVSLLAEHGADVNAQNNKGNSALFLACGNGHPLVVEELFRFGADSNLPNETALPLACQKNNNEIVKILLRNGALVTVKDEHSQSALQHACRHGYTNIARLLLKHKQDLEVKIDSSYTALAIASYHGHKEILEMLLNRGADIDTRTGQGDTPLMLASEKGFTDQVEILLEAGATVNLQNDKGVTALMYACLHGYEQIVSMLIRKKANIISISNTGITPLLLACQHRHKNIAEKLLKQGALADIPYEDGMTPLIAACEMSDKEIASLLLQFGADVTARKENGHTGLFFASQNGPLDLVELLIKHDADVNASSSNGLTPLILASAKSQEKIVEVLLRCKASVNAFMNDGLTALQIAAENGNLEIVKALLNAGADMTMKDIHGKTALTLALSFGRMDVVKELFHQSPESYLETESFDRGLIKASQKGPESKGKQLLQQNDTTPLLHAVFQGYPEVVEKLLVHGAGVNITDRDGQTAIFIASENGYKSVVDILLKFNADVNIAYKGRSPLFIACVGNNLDIAEMLLKHGANPNFQGETFRPLEYVVWKDNIEIADLLLQHGASPNMAAEEDVIPLVRACLAGNGRMVTLLLRNRAEPNFKTPGDVTPLIIAAARNFFDIVSSLISFNADVNTSSSDGLTPLLIASEHGFADIADILCAHSANVNAVSSVNEVTPMLIASQEGHVTVVNVLLKYGGSVNVRGRNGLTPLCTATDNNHLDVVVRLLEERVDINEQAVQGTTALYLAVQNENEPITEILLQHGADANTASSAGATPLIVACSKSNTTLVKMLLLNNADVNMKTGDGATPLYYASYFGSEEITGLLLQHGASSSINAQDKEGNTPLLQACNEGHGQIVTLLLQAEPNPKAPSLHQTCSSSNTKLSKTIHSYKTDVNVGNNNRETPLMNENILSNPALTTLLLQHGSIVNARDSHGSSPLLIASKFGHTEQVKTLLDHGAEVNAADDDGDTALFLACSKGFSEIVDILMKRGADVDLTNRAGQSPLDAARTRGDEEMVRRLLIKEEEEEEEEELIYLRV